MADNNDDLLREAKKRLQAAWTFDRENREEALKDLRFLALDQWPSDVRQKREAEGRPCLTLDHLNQHKNQVVNDIRQADIGIKVIPVDDKADPDIANLITGLLSDIQYQNYAQHVFALAADGAVSCGIGHFRIKTQYAEGRVFEQEIVIEPIPYPLAVYWDPAAVKPDRSDAEWCFVTEFIPTDTFKSRYPDAKPVDVEVARSDQGGLYWATRDGVLVAEYYRKKRIKKQLIAFADGSVEEGDENTVARLAAERGAPIGQREVEDFEVEQCLLSGSEILTGPDRWPGRLIPIVPIIGVEYHLEDKTIRMGLIRGARDPQQLYNYWRSAAAELIALAPRSKFLATDTQIGPYLAEWSTANTSPRPYLRYKPDPDAPGLAPQRIDPPAPPAAIWQEAALVVDDMKAATGIYDASLGARSNEQSGIAIRRRQVEGDVATYHFAHNLERSLQYAGRVLVDLIPKIYDTQRVVRILGDDEQPKLERVNWPTVSENGEQIVYNDLSIGRYDVRVQIGPSYTTQRLEARDAMLDYLKIDPQAVNIVRDLVAKTLDFEGAQEMAERLKKTIPPQYLPDNEQPQPQPPGPGEQLQLRAMGARIAEMEGKARKAHAEADQKEIETEAMTHTLPQPMPPQGGPPPLGGMPPM